MKQSLSDIKKNILAGMSPYDMPVVEKQDVNTCCKTSSPLGDGGLRLSEDLRRRIAIGEPRTVSEQLTQLSPFGETAKYLLKERRRLFGPRFLNIQTLMSTITATHGNDIEIWQQIARIRKGFDELQASMLKHLLFEKDFLFPWIASDNSARLLSVDATKTLKRQHSHIALLTESMIAKARHMIDRPEACEGQHALYTALMAFKVEVENHIQSEHTLLFPRILKKSVEQLSPHAER